VYSLAGLLGQLELDGVTSLLLDDHGSLFHRVTREDVADPQSHEITAAQFAVDSEIEQGQITPFALDLKPSANRPDFPWLQRRFLAIQRLLAADCCRKGRLFFLYTSTTGVFSGYSRISTCAGSPVSMHMCNRHSWDC
jgi:hypothetical protein